MGLELDGAARHHGTVAKHRNLGEIAGDEFEGAAAFALQQEDGAEIAAKLNLSVRTVEKHRANIMEKVGVREVASLTRWCIQVGLVDN
ncbi:MAG: LuxR family transcriptional regulator [Opitutus sp.]|nr:LuxR family transcriptional regulator [Opitutus sp.]